MRSARIWTVAVGVAIAGVALAGDAEWTSSGPLGGGVFELKFHPTDPLTAYATTRGAVAVPGLEISECDFVQVRVADQSALNQHWSLDRIGLRYRPEAPKGT